MLLMVSLAFAGSIGNELSEWVELLYSLVLPMMITLVVLAAAAYIIGQLFGAELRARASVYASQILSAVGVGAAVLIVFALLIPAFQSGGAPPTTDIESQLENLKNLAESTLIGLVMLFSFLAATIFALGQLFGAETRSRANVWSTGMIGGAIVAAVLYVILNQILPSFRSSLGPLQFGLGAYINVIFTIVFFVSFIIMITYLISKLLKVPEWEAYLSVEMSQLMNSFLVMFFVVALFATSEVVVASMTGTTSNPPLAAAQFLREWVADSVLTGLFDIFTIQACTSILSTFSRRIGEMVLTNVYKVFPGMDTFVSISNVLAFGLMSIYGSISFQIVILTFIDAIAVPLLLPGGLILRFFPPTRDAGSFLIALAFSFQLVFPATFLVHEVVLNELNVQPYNSPRLLIASLCGPFKYGVVGLLINPQTNPIFSGPLQRVGTMLAGVASETTLNIVSMAEFIPLMRVVALLSLLALFMPALSTIITIAFINGMAKFLVSKV